MRFRKKPVEIDAMQFTGSNYFELMRWYEDVYFERKRIWAESPDKLPEPIGRQDWRITGDRIFIATLEGSMEATPGDWIIIGIKAEAYPCKSEVFDKSYEKADEK